VRLIAGVRLEGVGIEQHFVIAEPIDELLLRALDRLRRRTR
jgi:hypothetical protein